MCGCQDFDSGSYTHSMERTPPKIRNGLPVSSSTSWNTQEFHSSANCSEISEMSCRERFSVLGTVRVRNQYDLPGRLTMPLSFRMSGRDRRFAHSGQNIESHGQGKSFASPLGLAQTSNHCPHVARAFACFSRPHLLRESTTCCVSFRRVSRRAKSAPSTDKPMKAI